MKWSEQRRQNAQREKDYAARRELTKLEARMREAKMRSDAKASEKKPGESVKVSTSGTNNAWAEPIVAVALRVLTSTVKQSIRDQYEGKVSVESDNITVHLTHNTDQDKSVYCRQVIIESDKRAGHRSETIGMAIASQLARELLVKSKSKGDEPTPASDWDQEYGPGKIIRVRSAAKRNKNNRQRVKDVLKKRAMKCVQCGETDELFPDWDIVCNHTKDERQGK